MISIYIGFINTYCSIIINIQREINYYLKITNFKNHLQFKQ